MNTMFDEKTKEFMKRARTVFGMDEGVDLWFNIDHNRMKFVTILKNNTLTLIIWK